MPVPVHLVVQPFADILFAIIPDVVALSLDLVHLELAIVDGSIGKGQLPKSILLALTVVAFVDGTVRPSLQTLTVLFIVSPGPNILRSIGMSVSSMTVSFIIEPLPLIHIAIGMVKRALAVSFTILPLAFVVAPVDPLLFAIPITDAIEPFTFVDGTIFEWLRSAHLAPTLLSISGLLHLRRRHINSVTLDRHRRLLAEDGFIDLGCASAFGDTQGIAIFFRFLRLRDGELHRGSVNLVDSLFLILLFSRAICQQSLTTSHLDLKINKI